MFRNFGAAFVVDAGLAAAYTGTRSAGPLDGVTMMRPPASLSQCRGFPSCAASTVASRVFCIDAATADSWTRNVVLPPAGTLNELPSGKENETPGMISRGSSSASTSAPSPRG